MIRKAGITLFILFLTACDTPAIFPPDATLPDGSVYYGESLNGKFHGKGKWVFSTGGYYEGYFENGLIHGEGEYLDSYGTIYKGNFDQGSASGKFTVTTTEPASEYQGDLQDWQFHGSGRYKNEEQIYQGKFKNGLYHGQGKLVWTSTENPSTESLDTTGPEYQGEFAEGKMQGKGIYTIEESIYDGEFANDTFIGQGKFTDAQGNISEGQFDNWVLHGEAKVISTDGTIKTGNFEYGYLSGSGKVVTAEGEIREGEFNYNELDGMGTLTIPGVSKYKGEFSYGSYHGNGVLEKYQQQDQDQNQYQIAEILRGKWRSGHYIGEGENPKTQGEIALENHLANLQDSLEQVSQSDVGVTNVYFLGIAGDGTQSVFRREIEFVSAAIRQRFNTENRELILLNHHTSAADYALATRNSIATALSGIASKMNLEDDILVAYLTSHGSEDHRLLLSHDDIQLSSITATELASTIKDSGIKWKLIMISACYSGGFIPELADPYTMVITAADADNTSFGCSEDSDGTYFGKAFFLEALKNMPDQAVADIFEQAKSVIAEWEKEEELDASNPQIHKPKAIVDKLQDLN